MSAHGEVLVFTLQDCLKDLILALDKSTFLRRGSLSGRWGWCVAAS